MDNAQNNLMSNWNLARDFPEMENNQVQRPNFLETIAGILKTIPIVFLEGEEGDGATTTLAQFCMRYPDKTFSLFVKPASRFSYSVDYLRLILAEQFYWYVAGKSFEEASIDNAEFTALIHQVRKKKKNELLYIVVDGLHQIPQEDAARIEEIFKDVLPIGVENFRFVIVGQQATFQKFAPKIPSKPYQQLKFNLEDTEQFLSDTGLTKEQAQEVHNVCKSIPGRIASVKRLLKSGIVLEDILQKEPTKYLEFIKLEFNILEKLHEKQKLILAIVAYAKRLLQKEDIQKISATSLDEINETLEVCSFLKLEAVGNVVYISESHRRHAEKALERWQINSITLQIDFLLNNPTSDNAVMFLPAYYQQLNKQQAIVDLISPTHYLRLLETTQSINALRNRANLAIVSATSLRASADVFKFSLQRGIFAAVGMQRSRESEVSALVALNQPEKALALASQAVAKDDRLSLLATYCKGVKKKSGGTDANLLSHIKELTAEIDFTENPDKAVEIASDIIFFDADLALEIVEKANKRATSHRAKDAALARLSITATLGNATNGVNLEGRKGTLISDSALQKFTSSLVAFTEQMPMSDVIQIASQMEVSHRIYFLRSVIDVRSDNNGVLDLVDFSLDVLIKETSYVPKSRDLAELSKPLAVVETKTAKVQQLIERFEAQLGLIANTAFSKDIALLQMRLAQAENKYDSNKAADRISQAYYEATTIKTPETQAESYAIMLSHLNIIDKDNALEITHGFRAVIQKDLEAVTAKILENTADHFEAIAGVLRALARNDIDAALSVAMSLNTTARRNQALGLIARTFATLKHSEERKVGVLRALGKITDGSIKDAVIQTIFTAAERNTSSKIDWVSSLQPTLSMIKSREIIAECKIVELRVIGLKKLDCEKELLDLTNVITSVDSRSAVTDFLFDSTAALAELYPDAAADMFELAQKNKRHSDFSSEASREILERCLYLVSRTFFGLIKFSLFDDDKLKRFSSMVELVPSSYSQIEIFADLAARAWSAKDTDLNKRIIVENCLPIADATKARGDMELYEKMCRLLFPVIFTFNSSLAFEYISHISLSLTEDALYEAALLLIRKMSPTEPYHSMEFDKFNLDGTEIHDLYSLLQKHKTDSGFYATLTASIEAISSKANRVKFTVQQKTDFAVKSQHLANSLLPDLKNIQHAGYKIASLGQIYRLLDRSHQQWVDLIQDATLIGNIADRGYVFLELAKCIPVKYDSDRKRLFSDALTAFDEIPSPLDRLSHYENYVNATSKDAASSAKETIKRAIILSTEIESTSRVEKHRRQLIDIAEQIEPGLADQLIELIDDDPARVHCKMEIKRSAELAKIKRDMADTTVASAVQKVPTHQLSMAAWKSFSQLVAGRLQPKPPEVMLEYLLQTKGCSLADAYGMHTWYIENLNKRLTRRQDIEAQVAPLAEALLLSIELTVAVIRHSASKKSSPISELGAMPGIFIVKPGEREEAVQYITSWLESNAEEYIKLCDPYFGPEEISFLNLILSTAPEVKVLILTSMSHLKDIKAREADVFENEWKRISDQSPPETEIIAIGTEGEEKSLFHDRWLLTKNSGLRIGTSLNSLGISKVSEISEMDSTQSSGHEQNLDRYYAKQKSISGQRFSYWQFSV